jgi:hypothetical protein
MTDLKKIEQLWPHLTPLQTLLLVLRVRWYLFSNAYANLPYAFRSAAFRWSARTFYPAHWLR